METLEDKLNSILLEDNIKKKKIDLLIKTLVDTIGENKELKVTLSYLLDRFHLVPKTGALSSTEKIDIKEIKNIATERLEEPVGLDEIEQVEEPICLREIEKPLVLGKEISLPTIESTFRGIEEIVIIQGANELFESFKEDSVDMNNYTD